VYAKQLWSEPYSLFTLFAAFYFLLCFRDERHVRDAFIAGIALGFAVATRVPNAALVPFFAWYGFAQDLSGLPRPDRSARRLIAFALPLALIAISIAWYDWVRYGNPLATGYRADETFSTPILLGLYGLLFSPGKGLFVYVPFLAALAFALPMFYRRARRETLLMLAIFAVYLATFSTWYYWWGGTNWGPRFLVPTIPFLVLAVAPAVEITGWKSASVRQETRIASLALLQPSVFNRWLFATIFSAFCLFAFGIELVGVSIPALAYRQRMVRLSATPEWDAIFLPQFSPLVGYFNLIKPTALDFAWIRLGDGGVSVDWLVILLAIAFIAFCGVLLLATMADRRPLTTGRYSLSAVILFAIALALLSLYRYRDDTRFGGGDGYRALLQIVQREERPRDVLILNDDARTPFFFNENRARMRWYGLSRDPKQFDDATRALLARLSWQYARVWFAYDGATADVPDPTRAWLNQSLSPIAQYDFDDGVHLIVYATVRQ
jgi:hypothetical protein